MSVKDWDPLTLTMIGSGVTSSDVSVPTTFTGVDPDTSSIDALIAPSPGAPAVNRPVTSIVPIVDPHRGARGNRTALYAASSPRAVYSRWLPLRRVADSGRTASIANGPVGAVLNRTMLSPTGRSNPSDPRFTIVTPSVPGKRTPRVVEPPPSRFIPVTTP